MEQGSWFELAEDEWDPIFLELQRFSNDNCRTITIHPFTITKNNYGLYEIENEEVHDCVSTMDQCYRYLCEYCEH
ncbi:hypothetical protein [Halobacillus sp. K22]|uniref:hypothetical protein n=1 Tax=Halobacillus sp. K22 TaxID=3457431 RepID=UPI003FCEB7F3